MSELSETPFRVYVTQDDGQGENPELLGAADDVSLGELLLDLSKRGLTGDGTRVGILYRPVEGQPGEWLVNPWA